MLHQRTRRSQAQGRSSPFHDLSVDIRISEAVTLEGGPLRWQTEDAPYEEQLLELHSHDGSDLIVTDVRVSQPGFSWEVDQPVPLRHYRIRLVKTRTSKILS